MNLIHLSSEISPEVTFERAVSDFNVQVQRFICSWFVTLLLEVTSRGFILDFSVYSVRPRTYVTAWRRSGTP